MSSAVSTFLERFFRSVVARRWWVVAFYALLVPPSVYLALRVQQDNSLDRLIVQSDPDYVKAKDFERVFGAGEYVILLAEAPDPFAPEVLARIDALERKIDAIPGAVTNSAVSVYRKTRGTLDGSVAQAADFRRFVTGTDLFRRQGLLGDGFLGIPVVLKGGSPDERRALLAALNHVTSEFEKNLAPLTALGKIGSPFVNAYLERETHASVLRYFPLFGFFIVVLNLALYRSIRALAAFMLTIGVCAALTVGYVGLTGGIITIVSSLVPMTILITCTATLVYVHSRFVDRPPGRTVDDHQIVALVNKFFPCTASIFATAVGFGSLAVSKIRPIREMGVWVAVGLVFTWVVVFTLFPALQKILRTPTQHERKVAGQGFGNATSLLPMFTYRWRWALVSAALIFCAVGAISLFGIPGYLAPMPLETNALEYISHDDPVYRDTKRFEKAIAGLSVVEVWLKGTVGSVTEPAVVRGLDRFSKALEGDPRIGSAVGPTTILRMLRYTAGGSDSLPVDSGELEKLCADFEQLVPVEPMLQSFVDKATLSQTHLSVITKAADYDAYKAIERLIHEKWQEALAGEPALRVFSLETTGQAALEAKISFHLVPTLIESFGITAAIIFGTFLLVFRSGAARLMAMIPSLFAILVMFAIMRATGIALNVATILIASTVLGTSENDQIHFFYHFLEKRKSASTESGLRHTLLVAGKAIFFATLINAGGFLAFALSDLPPMRHFGVLSALAFTLSMIADFTALPAALWIVFRDKPDALKTAHAPVGRKGR